MGTSGSVLWSALFLILMNFQIVMQCKHLFVDDRAPIMSSQNIHNWSTKTINDEPDNLQKWLIQNKLTLDLTKTNNVLFHPTKKVTVIVFYSIFMATCYYRLMNQSIKICEFFIDATFNWKARISHQTLSVAQSVGVLYKTRQHLSKHLI